MRGDADGARRDRQAHARLEGRRRTPTAPAATRRQATEVRGDQLADVASLTPGGVGVNQAFNVASLHDATNASTASAYSVGNQLLTTVWNFVLAAVLVAAAFGRSGGKRLVEQSSARARELKAHDKEASSGPDPLS